MSKTLNWRIQNWTHKLKILNHHTQSIKKLTREKQEIAEIAR
jgi:hypothetical protein